MTQDILKDAQPRKVEIGDNNPPSLIDEITSEYSDTIEECGNWLDGAFVENDGQSKAVDALLKDMKAAKKALTEAQTSETRPLNDAKTAIIASYKPTQADFDIIIKGLAAAQSPYKLKLAAEKEAAKRAAYDLAREKEREAAKLVAQAGATDIEAQREAQQAQQAAIDAKQAASDANRDKVKGLRTYKTATVTDYAAFFKWLQATNKELVISWLDEQATKHMNAGGNSIAGVTIKAEKKAV